MPISKMPRAWGGPVAGLRPTALVFESDASLQEALALALINSGYDVTLATSAEEAHRLMRERSFDRIYSSGEPRVKQQASSQQAASTGPRVEDQGDGTARVRLDQVLPWSSAVELLDVLAATTPDNDAQKETRLLS